MALLNRFSRLNDRAESGIFTFIVTKSVTNDLNRDATTKDFCYGYQRWALTFQRYNDKILGAHLLLRNANPNTACVLDFTLTLLNRQHFSQNQIYTKKQAKFNITNPMQGVSRWIRMSDLVERQFSNETGEFVLELTLSNMTTIIECDVQLSSSALAQFAAWLKSPAEHPPQSHLHQEPVGVADKQHRSPSASSGSSSGSSQATFAAAGAAVGEQPSGGGTGKQPQNKLINLETNTFTYGSFDWSLSIVPLAIASGADTKPEPICRVYLNRSNGLDTHCRVKYRVILGQQQQQQQQQSPTSQRADSKLLDQTSDCNGRIRGYQFRNTNLLSLVTYRPAAASGSVAPTPTGSGRHQTGGGGSIAADLRVRIELVCANAISEAKVLFEQKPSENLISNCCDRNKQRWSIETDRKIEDETIRLKLFFMDLQSVPRNHVRYISWNAHLLKLGAGTNGHHNHQQPQATRELVTVKNGPHSNYYLRDGIDLGTIMNTSVKVNELNTSPSPYLDENNKLTVHIEWIDSLLLFNHLYSNYDALATVQRHQLGRELAALQSELDFLEDKCDRLSKNVASLTTTPRWSLGSANCDQAKNEQSPEMVVQQPEQQRTASTTYDRLPSFSIDNKFPGTKQRTHSADLRLSPSSLQPRLQLQQQQQQQHHHHYQHHSQQQNYLISGTQASSRQQYISASRLVGSLHRQTSSSYNDLLSYQQQQQQQPQSQPQQLGYFSPTDHSMNVDLIECDKNRGPVGYFELSSGLQCDQLAPAHQQQQQRDSASFIPSALQFNYNGSDNNLFCHSTTNKRSIPNDDNAAGDQLPTQIGGATTNKFLNQSQCAIINRNNRLSLPKSCEILDLSSLTRGISISNSHGNLINSLDERTNTMAQSSRLE